MLENNTKLTETLNITDLVFAVLRVFTLLGGVLWLYFNPHLIGPTKYFYLLLLKLFAIYSFFLYLYILKRPWNINAAYKLVFFLDLTFLTFLIKITGGWNSDFYIAYFLLVALHSFYFSWTAGLLVAFLVTISYLLIIYPQLKNPHILLGNLALRLGFLFLIGISSGIISAQLKNTTNKLKKMYLETVKAFSEAMSLKDSYTKEHSKRVALLAEIIAKKMHLPEERIEAIKLAGFLHDIGKIGIRDSILQKNAKLNFAEWEEVKNHPNLSALVLKPIDLPKEVKICVEQHHERYDGEGYPKNLKGREIALGARILAVADSFEAMTSTRPYRNAFPLEYALNEIKKNSGTQFDKGVVDAFLSSLEEIKTLLRELGDNNIITNNEMSTTPIIYNSLTKVQDTK